MDKGAKKMLNPTIKGSLIYTKPNHNNKTKSNTYVIKKKADGKVVAHKVGKIKEEREGRWQGGCTQGWEDQGGTGLEPTHLGA
jgi:hypothetical protein